MALSFSACALPCLCPKLSLLPFLKGETIPKGMVTIARFLGEFKISWLFVVSTTSYNFSMGRAFRWEAAETLMLCRLVTPFTASMHPTRLLCKKKNLFFLHLAALEKHAYLKVPAMVIFLPYDPLISVQCEAGFVPTGPLQPQVGGDQVNVGLATSV